MVGRLCDAVGVEARLLLPIARQRQDRGAARLRQRSVSSEREAVELCLLAVGEPCGVARQHDVVPAVLTLHELSGAEPLGKAGGDADLREAIVEVGEELGCCKELGQGMQQLSRTHHLDVGVLGAELALQREQFLLGVRQPGRGDVLEVRFNV